MTGLLSLLAVTPRHAAVQPAAPAYVRGEAAFLAADIAGTERAFRDVLGTDTVVLHRVEATRILATLAWRVRRDTVAAAALFASGANIPQAAATFHAERARMLFEYDDYTGAQSAAATALREANGPADSAVSTLLLVQSLSEPLLRSAIEGRPINTAELEALRAVLPQLHRLVAMHPGQTRLARALVTAATLAGDGRAMLDGWESYYLIGTGDTSRGILHDARHTLATVLPRWRGAESPTPDRAAVIKALADSRFFDEAAALIMSASSAARDARSDEVVRYARFANVLRQSTDDYYRQVALGHTDTTAWQRRYAALTSSLWTHLAWSSAPPRFDSRRFASELDRRFGTYINFGNTAGYSDLHMGHRVVDEVRHVTQYGHTADLRFAALDAMVSNGFQTWFWDGRAGHGGWASKDLIIQVRSNYADGTLDAWNTIDDPIRRAQRDREIAADSASDAKRARSTPIAYFPSVAARMQRDEEQSMTDSLVRAGRRGAEVEAAFERLYGDAVQEASIFVHEGRHAIDKRIGTVTAGADLEFDAKLSELAFSPRPRLSLIGIMLANLGDNTPHGRANDRLARGLLAWMDAHSPEVAGLDRREGLLPQLPLLTNDQLRAAAASMDPMARARP